MTVETNQQVATLRNLFIGRQDVYGTVINGQEICIREALTDDIIKNHLVGKKRIGVYPILPPDNLVHLACIDVDQDDKEKVSWIISVLLENGIFYYLERSKSKGYHIWIFFDEAIQSKTVRSALNGILNKAGVSDVEVFPKQDFLNPNNGVGNFVFLPLYGESVKQGRTIFLTNTFEPYPDQWDHLSHIHYTRSETILELSEKYKANGKKTRNSQANTKNGRLDIARYLDHYKVRYTVKPYGEEATIYALSRCPFSSNHTTSDNKGDSCIIQGSDGLLSFKCFHSHCQGKTWADVREAISGEDSLREFLEGYSSGEVRYSRNLTEDLRLWIEGSFGKINIADCYRDLGVTTPKEKTLIRVNLHRMCEKGIIERGSINGTYIKIESRMDEIKIKDHTPIPLAITLPGDLQRHVAIFPKNLIVGAGSSNGGKTAYALNTAYANRDKFEVYYWTTEMDSDELTLRVHNFGYPKEEWEKIKFKPWTSHHCIRPDALNIVDYLEVRAGEFWRVGDDLRMIFERLGNGVALVFIQMDRGKQFGWGGQKTVDKARLYFTLDDNKLTIIKGKNWASRENPKDKFITFKLYDGAKFEWGAWSSRS